MTGAHAVVVAASLTRASTWAPVEVVAFSPDGRSPASAAPVVAARRVGAVSRRPRPQCRRDGDVFSAGWGRVRWVRPWSFRGSPSTAARRRARAGQQSRRYGHGEVGVERGPVDPLLEEEELVRSSTSRRTEAARTPGSVRGACAVLRARDGRWPRRRRPGQVAAGAPSRWIGDSRFEAPHRPRNLVSDTAALTASCADRR